MRSPGSRWRSSGGHALRTRLPLPGPELEDRGAAHTEATGGPTGPAVFSDEPSLDCSESVNPQSFGKVCPVSLWLTGPSSAVGGAARARVAPACLEVHCWQGLCPSLWPAVLRQVCMHMCLLTRVSSHACLLTRECFLGFIPGRGVLVRAVGQVPCGETAVWLSEVSVHPPASTI